MQDEVEATPVEVEATPAKSATRTSNARKRLKRGESDEPESPFHAAAACPPTPALTPRRGQPSATLKASASSLELFARVKDRIDGPSTAAAADNFKQTVVLGPWEIEAWCRSAYPKEYCPLPCIFVCEFCLQYMKAADTLARHMTKPHASHPPHPPGREIYRHGKLSVWEVDGKREKLYCQNLCLLSKLFLDHKTLHVDVQPFLFYILTEWDDYGAHIVGYFSKEKRSVLDYNLSCILTLPPFQRRGYGRFMIDFSYLLTRIEGKIGSPEKPLSDLGLVSYRDYWRDVILERLAGMTSTTVSIKDLSSETAITAHDIISTLQALGLIKYWRGKYVVVPTAPSARKHLEIDQRSLHWTPYNSSETA